MPKSPLPAKSKATIKSLTVRVKQLEAWGADLEKALISAGQYVATTQHASNQLTATNEQLTRTIRELDAKAPATPSEAESKQLIEKLRTDNARMAVEMASLQAARSPHMEAMRSGASLLNGYIAIKQLADSVMDSADWEAIQTLMDAVLLASNATKVFVNVDFH